MTTADTTNGSKPTIAQVARATGLAILVALVINVILYFISVALGWLPTEGTQGPVVLANVIMASIVPVIAGAILYFVLTRFLTYKRANNIFLIIASIALILMVASPFAGLVTPTFGAVLMLEIMHLGVGLPTMHFLTRSAS